MTDSSLLIDVMLWVLYLVLAAAAGLAVWSAVHGVRTHERAADALAARHTSAVGYSVAALVAVAMLLTFLLGSTQPVSSGGKTFADAFWLRATDMFIYTSTLLICLCSVIVAIAKFRR